MMNFRNFRWTGWSAVLLLIILFSVTTPANHSEAEDVYDFALKVERGTFSEQTGVNRLLALPVLGVVYRGAQTLGYAGRAFPFLIFINRLLAVASLFLFWKILGGTASVSSCFNKRDRECEQAGQAGSNAPPEDRSAAYYSLFSIFRLQPSVAVLGALGLAFSYGFWRYANEAETYMLATLFLLMAWWLALRLNSTPRSRLDCLLTTVFCSLISALGILVHLLNLIPLLLIIPLYYLLSKEWKNAMLHGALTGLLVLTGYALASPYLDWGELGAQHHALESGFQPINGLRGAIAFGQCLIGGNFLFGFESFRELLATLFPSRMLGEEFYMGTRMATWIKWAGIGTLLLLAVCGLGMGVGICKRVKLCRGKGIVLKTSNFKPLTCSALIWLLLHAVVVIRTEAGSPELWILALIPFWLVIAPFVRASRGLLLVGVLFAHNLIAGLLPVLPAASDYHAAKGQWLVEHAAAGDLVLTSYEPIMIFYLDYFSEADVVNSGAMAQEDIELMLGCCKGDAYALATFFKPLVSMQVRNSEEYDRMLKTGEGLRSKFNRIIEDEFGGIYRLAKEGK